MNKEELIKQALPVALKLIKLSEGCKLTAYQDGGGVWTCGWGETLGVTKYTKYTQQEADQRLETRTLGFMNAVLKYSPKLLEHSPEKLAACTSLCYNIGEGDVAKKIDGYSTSSVCRYIAQDNMQAAADSFKLWNKDNGVVVQGLVNRRKREADLFLSVRN